jgi:hypothetical protein
MFKGTFTAIADALSATDSVVRPRTATSTHGRTMQRMNIVSRELTPFDQDDEEEAASEPVIREQPWLRHRERC